jgi:polyisoprenoid-binding protein YceI
MQNRRSLSPVVIPMFVVVALLFASLNAFAASEVYKIDLAHSSIIFRAKHLNTGYVYGRFDDVSGTITYDESEPGKLAVDATIKVDSINTGNAKRDGHLKSPDFFSAKEFGTITFKTKSAKSAGDNKFEVTGDLMLHGQTKPITITLEKTGASSKMGQRTGWLSTFTVKRSDFGMSFMPDAISDEIELTVATEAVKG